MGAMHGRGSVTLALMSAFPLVLAGNWPVATLVTVALVPLMLWQLTMASKSGIGLVPRLAAPDVLPVGLKLPSALAQLCRSDSARFSSGSPSNQPRTGQCSHQGLGLLAD